MRMRKKPNLGQRLEQCAAVLVKNPEEDRGSWLEKYGRYKHLHLEIGCGKGKFTVETAKFNPDILFAAVEKVQSALVMAMEKAQKNGAENIVFLDWDAANITSVFAPGEVERIYLNFCDPWPKSRDAKFRLTAPSFLRSYADILAPGGVICFKTDNKPLFDWSVKVMEEEGWQLNNVTNDLHRDGPQGVMTDYEVRFYQQGIPINRLEAVKTDGVKADDTKVIAAKTDTAKANKGKPGQAKAGNAKKSGAKSGTAKYSVDAEEIEYDMESGDGTTTGKTVIKHDGGTAVGQKGSTFNSKKHTGHLYGGVVAHKEDQHLTSEELFIYSDKYYSAVGNAVVKKADKTLTAPRVDYHDDTKFAETMGGTARLEATDGSWVTAGKITYDMKEGLANATGGVKLESPPRKLTGSGDTAIYNTKETGYIDLIGNATAVQDGNTVKGDKLRITNTSPNHNRTHAEGNVQLVFAPKDENAQVNNPAFGEGAVLMANGRTNFNPAENIMDRVKKMNFDTEGKTA